MVTQSELHEIKQCLIEEGDLVRYKLVREYPGSPKQGSYAYLYGRSSTEYYRIKYGEEEICFCAKKEVEESPLYWRAVHNLKVGDTVVFDTLTRVIQAVNESEIQLNGVWYGTTEFGFYGIAKLTDEVLELNTELAKYQQKMNAIVAWNYLKKDNPRIYWLEILRLIASEFNSHWKPNWQREEERWQVAQVEGYLISAIDYNVAINNGLPTFRTEQLAQRAIKLLQQNINYLF